MPKRKFYAVRIGRVPGVYENWDAARTQVDGFPGALHKSFTRADKAFDWFEEGRKPPTPIASTPKRHSPPRPRAAAGSAPSVPIDVDSYPVPDDPPSSPDFQILSTSRLPTSPSKRRREHLSYDGASDDPFIGRSALKVAKGYAPHATSSPSAHLAGLKVDSQPSDYPYTGRTNGVGADNEANPAREVNDEEITLSEQQAETLQRVVDGESIFFTGSAGTGKSVLLRAIIRTFKHSNTATLCNEHRSRTGTRGCGDYGYEELESDCSECAELSRKKTLAVTASTGMAALNIGGTTIHSWAGIAMGKAEIPQLIAIVRQWSLASKRWCETDTLLVDEVSMLSAELLDKLDAVGRAVRGINKPFGGIQLVFCGDFFQLPPVKDKASKSVREGSSIFGFDATCWDKMFPRSNIVQLKQVFRQTDDKFISTLENMRVGEITDEQNRLLLSLDRPVSLADGITPVRLYSMRHQVDSENQAELEKLPGPVKVFKALDIGFRNSKGFPVGPDEATRLLNRGRVPENLFLAVGAQVMLVMNWKETGLVNGSTGRVTGFSTVSEARTSGIALPPKLAQSEARAGGSFLPANFATSPESFDYEEFPDPLGNQVWPVVDFKGHRSHGSLSKRILVTPMDFIVENANNEPEAKRVQVPLILAWALTIHKAQGLTLDKVRVDLRGTFDTGQAYVAISRARSLQGLELRGYHRDHIWASPRVLEWAKQMEEDELLDNAISSGELAHF